MVKIKQGLRHPDPQTFNSTWRLLDANINRAREGLRVLEDTARFVLNLAPEAKDFRRLRHTLDEVARVNYRRLLAARDVAQDSGRASLSAEYKHGVPDLLAANFKRCEEALRVLEEYGRVLSPTAILRVQKIRFEVYDHEKNMTMKLNQGAGI